MEESDKEREKPLKKKKKKSKANRGNVKEGEWNGITQFVFA